ncbi:MULTISPECIES: response regulator transcription factor [Thiomicrorhabdus]|uniref:Response regulator transcription factor n=1 Tax=Thiomicrorhabdus heinhorstiae TaxID=2748010 RepID=A0ABS0BXH7_9GAMM|nr:MULTISPECIES: response regulator transcription factor [Thiomicrorhabdus]MBF6057785.1 response regulator transcription factor [Thiomicrorhabdus heinhorstiae]
MRILLTDDDPDFGLALQTSLKKSGMTVDWVTNAEQALAAINTENFDLLLLDLTLPKMDGITLLKELRQAGNDILIIILTARDSLQDRIQGLDLGADDYLSKPFNIQELVSRIQAVSRRREGRTVNEIRYKGLQIDLSHHCVSYQNQDIKVTKKEFILLKVLLEHQGRIVSKQQLEEKLYSWQHDIGSNSIEVHIHNLRKKIPIRFIETIRGLGYRVEPQ